jgi:hypothetical protein
VIEAESQAVLNPLKEHGFQDEFQNGRNAGKSAYTRKGTTSRVMVTSRPKLSFLADGSTSHGNYGWFFEQYQSLGGTCCFRLQGTLIRDAADSYNVKMLM